MPCYPARVNDAGITFQRRLCDVLLHGVLAPAIATPLNRYYVDDENPASAVPWPPLEEW